ncbi:MAG: DUF1223 domain-containing protein [Chitinophagaceae bacterium]
MKCFKYSFIVWLFIAASAFSSAVKTAPGNIVVVELFTSEGCSSCPSADAAVTRLAGEFKDEMIVLAYHIDYWNRLGWKDKFSRAEYTSRQSAYANKFSLNSIYTPQALVNGTNQLVGSEEAKLRGLIKKASGLPSRSHSEIQATVTAKGEIAVSATSNASSNQTLNIVLVQRQGMSKVTAGENTGKQLSHTDIVRELKTFNSRDGKVNMKLPAGLKPGDCKVVAFLQNIDSFEISGASLAAIQP